jgi:hypothetical protein
VQAIGAEQDAVLQPVASLEIGLVSLQVLRGPLGRHGQLHGAGLAQHVAHGLDNIAGNLALDQEHVFERLFVRLRPEVCIVLDVNELCRHAYAIVCLANAALEYVVDLELVRDRHEVEVLVSKGK